MERRNKVLWQITLILFGLSFVLVTAAVIAAKSHLPQYSLYAAIPGGFFLVLALILSTVHDRRAQSDINKYSQMINRLGITPADAKSFDWLDKSTLDHQSSELSDLNFAVIGDYTLNVEDAKIPKSFIRVAANEKYKCFAEIGQSVRPANGLKAMVCSIVTYYKSGEECRTGNGEAVGTNPLPLPWINSESVPGASPAQLLAYHLAQRDKYAVDKKLEVLDDASRESYEQQVQKRMQSMREWFDSLVPNHMR